MIIKCKRFTISVECNNSFFFLFESLLCSLRNGRQFFHDSVYAFLFIIFFEVYIHADPDELVPWNHLDEWVD